MLDRSPLIGKSSAFAFVCYLISASSMVGCASNSEAVKSSAVTPAQAAAAVDPYEGFNRSIYGFNMTVDRNVLKPVASGYRSITPDFMQAGVSNFFSNLKGINVVLNDVLQGKLEQGANDIGRFTANSTLGLFGLFDVASSMGLDSHVEDFGQTLAVWGVDQGAYLVLPFLGPTTLRDGPAGILDRAANPGTYVPGTGIVEGISDRANADGALNFIDEAALDPYVFTRESFLQYRSNLIKDGKVDPANYDLDIDAELNQAESAAPSAKPEPSTDNAAAAKKEAKPSATAAKKVRK